MYSISDLSKASMAAAAAVDVSVVSFPFLRTAKHVRCVSAIDECQHTTSTPRNTFIVYKGIARFHFEYNFFAAAALSFVAVRKLT